ncbi:hypothetical protein BUALT_Bualt03G0154600 [Buddleja alternifolia]|uniref:Peptidase S26 domain-containing protein n=1 Tax=Buddleja alternifolia TaxID=168488 RepID=A0AAV6XU01_9LAMI|nr:hypothetical protein BUALT_Bualt03G0154600 [Buddleja alternifolia]
MHVTQVAKIKIPKSYNLVLLFSLSSKKNPILHLLVLTRRIKGEKKVAYPHPLLGAINGNKIETMRAAKLLQYARQWRSTAKEVFDHSILFAQFLSILHLTDTYICSPTLVYGPSMLPTLNFTGDVLLVDKLSPLLGKVGTGDVVLVRSPENPRKTITKRVLGMEGDRVTFLLDPAHSARSHSLVVPKGHVWIQGDNIYASNDSRHVGPIPYGLILGRVFCRLSSGNMYGHLGTLDHWDNDSDENCNCN